MAKKRLFAISEKVAAIRRFCVILMPMMSGGQIILWKIGVVVVGANHNPSILTPDFLRYNNIAPDGAAPDMSLPHRCTPGLSQVFCNGGLQIISDPNRVSIQEELDGGKSPAAPDMACRYLSTVRHVNYTAVGVNPVGIYLGGDAKPENLLAGGWWAKHEGMHPAANIQLAYSFGARIINLAVGKSAITTGDGEQEAVVVEGNFHQTIGAGQNESYAVAAARIGEWESDLEVFRQMSENIINKMKEVQR